MASQSRRSELALFYTITMAASYSLCYSQALGHVVAHEHPIVTRQTFYLSRAVEVRTNCIVRDCVGVLSLYTGPVVAVMGHLMVCRPNARSVRVCLVPVVNCDKMVQPDIDLLRLAQRLTIEFDTASRVLAVLHSQ